MPSLTQTLLAATLASLSLAMTVTSPTKHQLWDSSKANTITWSSVSTDPKTVDIYLAHMSVHPPLYSLLFSDVSTSTGSAVVSNLQLPSGEAYQINLVASDNDQQILAQSQQFNVTGEAVAGATSTVDGYTGATYIASATTLSGTATGSATRTASLTTVTSTSTNSNGSTVTGTSTETASSEEAESTDSSSSSASAARATVSAASTSASSTRSGNAAAPTQFVAGGSVMAVVLGVAAFLA